MNGQILWEPRFELTFSSEEKTILCECSALHYDKRCVDLMKIGGPLWPLHYCDNVSLTFRELDTVGKALEVFPNCERVTDLVKVHGDLQSRIILFLRASNEHTPSAVTFLPSTQLSGERFILTPGGYRRYYDDSKEAK